MSKLMIAAFAVAWIVALSGCMSLEERLASSDPRVKNEAEHELVQISRATGTESDRIAAINKIANRDFLYEIAMKATTNQWVAEDAFFDPSGYDGYQTAGNTRVYYKVTSYGPIYKRMNGKSLDTTKDGVAAFERLSLDISKIEDRKKLFELVQRGESPYVKLAVLKSVKEANWAQAMAQVLASVTTDPAIQAEAFARIKIPEARLAAMARCSVDAKTRKEAFAKLTDQKTIDNVILKTFDKELLLEGMSKVSDKDALALRVFSKDFIGDKDVTGKFIADCADEAMLVKIVNEYGEKLSSEQCAAIKAKSSNAEIQNAIATLADKKILSEILAAEKKYQETRANDTVEVIVRLFSQMHSLDMRRQYIMKVMAPKDLISAELRDRFSRSVSKIVKPEDIVPIFKDASTDEQTEILKIVADENVIKTLVAVLKEGMEWEKVSSPFYIRTSGFREIKQGDVKQEEIDDLLVLLPSKLDYYLLKNFIELARDNTLDVAVLSKFKFEGFNNQLVRELVKISVRKLTTDSKKKLCDAARKKAEAQKDKAVVFGPFYLGMPYLDALLLQEEIWGVDQGIGIWSNYQEKGEHSISDMARVWKISFNNKAKFQFIDCKDSLVLPQFIHQFVEGKSGKVSSDFSYASDIRSEYDENDERIYSSYSNTKRGIKVQYSAKYGILNMVEL